MGLTISQISGLIRSTITALLDGSSEKLTTIDYAHKEIHGGTAYVVSQFTAANVLDIAAPLTYRITTPAGNKHLHLTILADVSAAAVLEVYRDIGNPGFYTVTGGTPYIPRNMNGNYPDASIATIRFGATVTVAGPHALIKGQRLGGFKQTGGASTRQELVLKADNEYLIRLTSDADNNEGSLILEWYEHTDRSM